MEISSPIKFSQYMGISEEVLEKEWVFDILVNYDLPLFIDPFLLFCYQEYNERYLAIAQYLLYLKEFLAQYKSPSKDEIKHLFHFSEVSATHLWYTVLWNEGAWLWVKFRKSLIDYLNNKLPEENVNLEQITLFSEWVWRDRISDFTTNIIKPFLAEYTQEFVKKYLLDSEKIKEIWLERWEFDYSLGIRKNKKYQLPVYNWKPILLVPEVILTSDEMWISLKDFKKFLRNHSFLRIENEDLRYRINQILKSTLKEEEKKKELEKVVIENPQIYQDYYAFKKEPENIKRQKESSTKSRKWIEHIGDLAINDLTDLINKFEANGVDDSFTEAIKLIDFFKKSIEYNDVYKLFYYPNGDPINSEEHIQLAFRLVRKWSKYCIDAEVNKWRWPVDFKISRGANDVTIIEFKLWKNSKLEHWLTKQVEVYEQAHGTTKSVKVVFCYNDNEIQKTNKIISNHNLNNVIIIDLQVKKSASNA